MADSADLAILMFQLAELQAKKLAEEYPEIKCESYGFGPERCLPQSFLFFVVV
jgi:hypothetical protein